MSEHDDTHVDVDGDGDWDEHWIHENPDGSVDVLADMNHDGHADFIGHDYDRDGLIDSSEYDKNYDGRFETHMSDSNHNGWQDHEVADRNDDPMVLVHARALLTSSPEGACDYVEADVHDPK